MRLRVRAKQQSSGSLQHITYYDAEIELADGEVQVEISGVKVASAMPMSPEPGDVEAARQAILQGARDVLDPRRLGARIRVDYMLLHPIDFQPKQFRRYTALELEKLLEARLGTDG